MGLETASFISGLTAAWPLAGDKKNQGDDHLRLIKVVLQSTFPSADRAFYFPKTEAITGTLVLDATDQNNDVLVDTSGGNVAVTLPSTLTSSDKGWECTVVKTTNDANAAIVSPASGSILSKSGSTATIRVGLLCDPARFKWTGTQWICYKSGPMIGSTENFDGSSLPPGYLDARGGTYSSTDFAELFAVLATSTLKDKAGRVEAGQEAAASRLTASYFGGDSTVVGAVGGLESHLLTATHIPTHYHGIVLTDPGHFHSTTILTFTGSLNISGGASANINLAATNSDTKTTGITISDGSGNLNRTATYGNGASHNNTQPTIIVRKIIRAC